jgi:hypothetical protein
MKRNQLVTFLTLAVLVGAMALIWIKKGGSRSYRTASVETTPRDAIYSMLDAGRAGDVRKYLDCYSGQMLASLNQAAREAGETGFQKYLKDSSVAIKGIAVSEPQPITDREVRLRVEYVYQDRNEAQVVFLEKGPSGWRIVRVEAAERVKTPVPYGTPVEVDLTPGRK